MSLQKKRVHRKLVSGLDLLHRLSFHDKLSFGDFLGVIEKEFAEIKKSYPEHKTFFVSRDSGWDCCNTCFISIEEDETDKEFEKRVKSESKKEEKRLNRKHKLAAKELALLEKLKQKYEK